MRTIIILLLLSPLALAQYTIPQSTGATAASGGGGGNTWTTSTGWSASGTTTASLTCSPACPAITIPTSVIGDAIAIVLFNGAGGVSVASGTGPGTVSVPTCEANQASAGHLNCAYVITTSATTTLNLTLNGSQGGNIFNIRSYHPSSTTPIAETVPTGTTSTSCGTTATKCNAPNVTLVGTSDVVVSAISTADTGCSVTAPFGNFASPAGDGMGDNLNTSSGTGGAFIQGNSCPTGANAAASMVSLAFR
jgi:hypothetical protein